MRVIDVTAIPGGFGVVDVVLQEENPHGSPMITLIQDLVSNTMIGNGPTVHEMVATRSDLSFFTDFSQGKYCFLTV